MKKSSLKDLVEQIQKVALAPPPPPIVDAPASSTNTATPPTTTYHPSGASSSIKEMQQAMQSLADAVMRDAQSQTMAYKPNDAIQPNATSQEAAAKKGFNDFIAEQYLGALDDSKKGVEWTTDKSVTSHPGKAQTQTDIYELDVVMDTLRRIGTGSKEFSDDGSWGFRTDNALKNIMGFAYGLLQLEGDFGFKNEIYTLKDWETFNKLLSGYTVSNRGISLPLSEQSKRAQQITNHLNLIKKLYSDFRRQVPSRPEFRPLLEGKRSFETYDNLGTNKDTLTPQEEELSKNNNVVISGLTFKAPALPSGAANSIPLSALQSKENFEKYLKEIGWTEENIDGGIASKLLKVIKEQLNRK